MNSIDLKLLLTNTQLAEALDRCPATVVQWAKSGRIPVALWIGADVRGARYNLQDVIEALRSPPPKTEASGAAAADSLTLLK